MYGRMIKNDIRNTRLITIATALFVAVAALLVSLAGTLWVSLLGANETLTTQAKSPHAVQMHAGEIDRDRLTAFAENNRMIDQFQIAEFLNMKGSDLFFNGNSMVDSVEDNGFAIQNELFDFLLDIHGNIIHVKDGEVYIPVFYWKEGIAEVGDKLTVFGKEFIVAGLLRDSVMNSSLSGSKRILISQNDYADVREYGRVEYLIEMRARNIADTEAMETAYSSAGLESNGPLVDYRIFALMNGLTEGVVIGMILLVAILVTGVAFLCIRFTLLAKIEEEYREIGVMKAIGIRVSDMKKLYLAKYAVMSAAGCIAGYGLSFFFREKLTENIRLFLGEGSQAFLAPLYVLGGVFLVFLTVILYVNGVLRLFKKIPAAEALRFGMAQDKRKGSVRFRLSSSRVYRFTNTNIFLGIKDVWNRKRLYITMLVVLVVCAFVILVPRNLSDTVTHPQFMTYLGVGQGFDFSFSISQAEEKEKKAAEIVEVLKQNPEVAGISVLTSKIFNVLMEDGTEEQIRIELGDPHIFPVSCYEGRLPETGSEIALSGLNADSFGKSIGDSIILVTGEGNRELTVCGIYSDIQNGGKTAKATFADEGSDIWYIGIAVNLVDTASIAGTVAGYAQAYPDVKIADVGAWQIQTYGNTMRSVETVSFAAMFVAVFLTILITVLFMKLLVAKDRYAIAVLKASGYTNRDIMAQYASRFVLVLLISVLLGTVLANLVGEPLTIMATSTFGVKYLQFNVNPLFAYFFCPFMMLIAVLLAMMMGTGGIRRVRIMENIKE